MSVLEKSIEKRVRKYAEKGGCLSFKMNGPGHRGWPDRMFLFKGNVIFVEFKRAGKKATPHQEQIHAELRAQGFDVFVVDSVALGMAAVEGLWATGPSTPPKRARADKAVATGPKRRVSGKMRKAGFQKVKLPPQWPGEGAGV